MNNKDHGGFSLEHQPTSEVVKPQLDHEYMIRVAKFHIEKACESGIHSKHKLKEECINQDSLTKNYVDEAYDRLADEGYFMHYNIQNDNR
jgi:hypothetical protein